MTLTVARQRRIIEIVQSGQEVLVSELARVLSVSEMTIRRDLKQLEEDGKLRRVHGGAVPMPVPDSPPLRERMRQEEGAKRAIASLAAGLVEEGHRLFLGAGSTNLALARELARGASCRVLTSTPEFLEALAGEGRHEIELTAGRYDPVYRSLYGEQALSSVRDRMFDIAFVSAYAIDAAFGVLDNGEHQHHLQRILVERARLYVVLADHTKLGRPANFCSLPWSSVDVLVSDRAPDERLRAEFEAAEVTALSPDAPA